MPFTSAPPAMVNVPVPNAPGLPSASEPAARVVPPEYELAAESVQRPEPCLRSAVVFNELLLTIVPANSPAPKLEPCKVNVLEPSPVAVNGAVNFTKPSPD